MANAGYHRRIAADYLREQLQMDGESTGKLGSIFEEEPPPLSRFLYDSKYLNHLRKTTPTLDEESYAFRLSPIQWEFLRNFEQIFYPELYIAMVEEFGEEWAPMPMKNLFALSWGKCPVEGELVYNSKNGQWVKIEDLAEDSQMSSVDPDTGKLHDSIGTHSWISGVGPSVEVVTSTGAKTKVYEGHKFLTPDGWMEAKDLKVGDSIANASRLSISEPVPLLDEHVDRLALLIESEVPREVFSLPRDQVHRFLAGLFLNSFQYITGSEDVARGVYRLLKRVDVVSSVQQVGESRWMVTKKSRVTDDIIWDKVISITSIGLHKYYDLTVGGLENYVCTDGVIAHNSSGKDTVVRLGFVRIASLLTSMRNPQSYYNMASIDSIELLNVATNATQARDAFFDPMKKLFKSNKYLSEMFVGDDPAEGANRLKLKKNIMIISGNSLADNQEGLNLIAGVADEISAFKVASEFQRGTTGGDTRAPRGAEAIVSMLRSSSSTRFPKTYKVAQISWPRFSGDAIEQAVEAGRKSIASKGDKYSEWFVSGPYATWEVKPGVTKADFDSHFEEDPEKAWAMYGARPPRAVNRFIRDDTTIDASFEEIKPDPITFDFYLKTPEKISPDQEDPKPGWEVKFYYDASLKPIEGAQYCLHGDLALVGDRAGIAMSHVKSYRGDEERPIIKNDFVFAFESDLAEDPPREVQIRWYRQLVWELIERGFNIVTVTFDQFQSVDMIQTLTSQGVSSSQLSLDRNDKVYQAFKDVVLDSRLEGYKTTPDAEDFLVIDEIKRLRRVGKKIDHPHGGSKDLADALAGSVFNAINAGGEEDSIDMGSLTNGFAPTQEDMNEAISIYMTPTPGTPFNLFGSGTPRTGPRW